MFGLRFLIAKSFLRNKLTGSLCFSSEESFFVWYNIPMIKVKCPAKINLTLEVVNRREDGFHNIKSVMQMIGLYDFLTINLRPADRLVINLSGTSDEIPYNEKNLVYKAAELLLNKVGITSEVDIHIEKNIPIAAGLAGGSTDAAGTLWGLNRILGEPLNSVELEKLCASLGSDLNVCLNGGCVLATSRGEITETLPLIKSPVTLIKPKHLGISAGEAYKKYVAKEFKPHNNCTEKMISELERGGDIRPYLYNDLEYAVFDDYAELQEIKKAYPQAVMSGSGSTYFALENIKENKLGEDFLFINGLEFVSHGVCEESTLQV